MSSSLKGLEEQLSLIDQKILTEVQNQEFKGLTSKQLSSASKLLNEAIRFKLNQLFGIPAHKITDDVIGKYDLISKIIKESSSAMKKKLEIYLDGALDVNELTRSKKQKKKVRQGTEVSVIDSLKDLDKPELMKIARELGWEFNDNRSEEIVLRAAKMLKNRVKFLVEYPDGIRVSEESIIGTINDPDILADINKHNSTVRRRGFRSIRPR